MNDRLRWGIVGAGRFGKVHARALQSLHGVELVAIARRDPIQLAATATELGVKKAYPDYRQLLADPEVEVVSICTHWRQHHEVAAAALASGKHVLLEKPMAASGAECRSLLDAANNSSQAFMVGHVCRFDPRVTLAREAIAAGRIGRIISIHAKRNLPVAPGSLRLDKISPLMGDGIHDADLMLWLIGLDPTRVYARNLRVGAFLYPDVGWAMIEFGESALGVVETNWCLPANAPTTIDARMEIVGTAGQLTIDCAHTGLSILSGSGLRQPDTMYWPAQHDRIVGALVSELAYFAECVRSGTRPTAITPVEATRAVELMERAEQSAALGQPLPIELTPLPGPT